MSVPLLLIEVFGWICLGHLSIHILNSDVNLVPLVLGVGNFPKDLLISFIKETWLNLHL